MEMIFVKPCDGKRVRDPMNNNAVIPAGGKRVQQNGYWTRRLLDGDVEEVKLSMRRRASRVKDKPEETTNDD